MSNVPTKSFEVVRLRPMKKNGVFLEGSLPLSAPYKGACVEMGCTALIAAWDAAGGGSQRGVRTRISMPRSRTKRRQQEILLCKKLAEVGDPVIVEYIVTRGRQEQKKLMLSKGACELIATYLESEGPTIVDEYRGGAAFATKEIAIMGAAGGLIGEVRVELRAPEEDAVAQLIAALAPSLASDS